MSWTPGPGGTMVSQTWGGLGNGNFKPAALSGSSGPADVGRQMAATWAGAQAPKKNVGGWTGYENPSMKNYLWKQMNQPAFGGQSGPSPEITVGPVWNDSQVQQRVNQMRAGNDATVGSQVGQMNQSLGGRGFGSGSPLAQEMEARMRGMGMMANSSGENDLRWNAAQGNAQHVLGTQVARSNQFAQRMDEDVRRKGIEAGRKNNLLEALMNNYA